MGLAGKQGGGYVTGQYDIWGIPLIRVLSDPIYILLNLAYYIYLQYPILFGIDVD